MVVVVVVVVVVVNWNDLKLSTTVWFVWFTSPRKRFIGFGRTVENKAREEWSETYTYILKKLNGHFHKKTIVYSIRPVVLVS